MGNAFSHRHGTRVSAAAGIPSAPATPLPTQLPAGALRKAPEGGPSVRAPAACVGSEMDSWLQPGARSGPLPWVPGPRHPGLPQLPSQAHLRGTGSEVEQPLGLKPLDLFSSPHFM